MDSSQRLFSASTAHRGRRWRGWPRSETFGDTVMILAFGYVLIMLNTKMEVRFVVADLNNRRGTSQGISTHKVVQVSWYVLTPARSSFCKDPCGVFDAKFCRSFDQTCIRLQPHISFGAQRLELWISAVSKLWKMPLSANFFLLKLNFHPEREQNVYRRRAALLSRIDRSWHTLYREKHDAVHTTLSLFFNVFFHQEKWHESMYYV